jgi:dolichol-phosphate mannosyltransferase
MRRPTNSPAISERSADESNLEESRVDEPVVHGRDVADAPRRKIGSLTVLVPTRNESGNIAPLLDRLGAISHKMPLAVLFVDDSTDDTPQVIRRLARRSTFAVDVLHRPEGERTRGLGGAVRAGLKATRSELVCVMDADLQHPPELLPALIAEGQRSQADVVVASRHSAGGDLATFSAGRRALSRASALVARALFPFRLRGLSDPMSGFFLVRRVAIDVTALRPNGFKILLEILLSGSRRLSISEVGFRFGERHAGDSKATLREGGRYLRRLITLRILRWKPPGKRGFTVASPVRIPTLDADATR